MTDIILKNIQGKNLNLEIVGFDGKLVYHNVAIGSMADVSGLDFYFWQASVLEDGLIDYTGYLFADDDGVIEGSSVDETRTLTAEELAGTIQLYKAILKKRCEIKYLDQYKLQVSAPAHEVQSWAIQKEEAEKFQQDANAALKLLPVLAQLRGVTVAELAKRVLARADAFNEQIAAILGEQKKVTDKIKAAATMSALRAVESEDIDV